MDDPVRAHARERAGDGVRVEQVDGVGLGGSGRCVLPAGPHQAVDLVAERGAVGDQVASREARHARDEHAHRRRLSTRFAVSGVRRGAVGCGPCPACFPGGRGGSTEGFGVKGWN